MTMLWAATQTLGTEALGGAATSPADHSPADKSQYTLFDRTPAFLMRDFNSNRPSVTEGPFTVDAGHLQFEASFVEFTHDNERGVLEDQLNILPADARIGILNNFEIDVMFDSSLNSLVHGKQTPTQRQVGTGDMQVRGALNLWGDDGGVTAGGVLAFVSFPVESGSFGTNHVQGGIILPIDIKLPAGFEAGAMIESDFDRNEKNDGYGVDLVHTATISHELVSHVSSYIEYVGISPMSTGRTYLSYFDTGITWALTPDMQLDCGVNLGIADKASDYTVFMGLSLRL
jgi:Putative MetA-pathway of phenol degradation